MAAKYERNKFDKYDCPKEGCDRKGKQGFDFPQGVGKHLLTEHAGYPPKAVKGGEPEADNFEGTGFAMPAPLARKAAPQRRTEAEAPAEASEAQVAGMSAREAAIAILQLAPVQDMSSDALKQVFDHVIAIKAIDEQPAHRPPSLFEAATRHGHRPEAAELVGAGNGGH